MYERERRAARYIHGKVRSGQRRMDVTDWCSARDLNATVVMKSLDQAGLAEIAGTRTRLNGDQEQYVISCPSW